MEIKTLDKYKKIKKKQIIYCGYCQHDLRTWGLICHDSQKQTNIGDNYFIIDKEKNK